MNQLSFLNVCMAFTVREFIISPGSLLLSSYFNGEPNHKTLTSANFGKGPALVLESRKGFQREKLQVDREKNNREQNGKSKKK